MEKATNKSMVSNTTAERHSVSMLKIGVVGYCPPTVFDEDEARQLLHEALNEVIAGYPHVTEVWIVSGLTDVGIPALAYREARARGWWTMGVACAKAHDYRCFQTEKNKIVGQNWGDESETL
ncbi:MAG TPA: hypothetical protein VFZ58_05665 [Candidatus Saccharimonadales bacterium]